MPFGSLEASRLHGSLNKLETETHTREGFILVASLERTLELSFNSTPHSSTLQLWWTTPSCSATNLNLVHLNQIVSTFTLPCGLNWSH